VIDSLNQDRLAARVDADLPLRASTIADADHYDPETIKLSGRIEVLLDGKALPEVAAWDVLAEEVIRKRRDEDGRVIVHQGQPTYETLCGRVEVRWTRQPETHRHA
jgi:hypothetical protein